jgi:hypothetical protein
MGIIGNEGGRKDIVIIGDAVEKAFLYMNASMRSPNNVFVDYQTKLEASKFIEIEFLEHVEFSNKYTNYPIFEPQNPFLVPCNFQKCKNQFHQFNEKLSL